MLLQNLHSRHPWRSLLRPVDRPRNGAKFPRQRRSAPYAGLRFLLLFAAAAVLFGIASSTRATTLWDVWQQAEAHAPALEQAEATLEQAQATHSAALAKLLPALNLNASRVVDNQSASGPQFYGSSIVNVDQAANTRTNGWQLQLSQPLFDWNAIQTLSAADYTQAAGVARAEAMRQALMATIAQDYMAVLSAQALLAASREAQTGFSTQAFQAEARYKAGLSGIIGSDETKAALAQAQSETLAAAQALKQARRQLDTDAGTHVSGPFPALPADLVLPLPQGGDAKQYLQTALDQNPLLAAARLDRHSADHALSAAHSGYLPTVSLALSHQRNFVIGSSDFSVPGSSLTSPATQDASQNVIGLQLSWAIFSGGATSAAAHAAEAQLRSADASARTAELTIASQMSNALDGIASNQQRVQQLQSGVVAAQSAVTATAAAVSKGLSTEQNLVIARQALLSLETSYAGAISDLVTSRLALAQALGTLTPGLLSQVSVQLVKQTSTPSDSSLEEHPPHE